MTFKAEIEKKYDELLSLAEKYDACFEGEATSFGSPRMKVKVGGDTKYWQYRTALEEQFPLFMSLLRKAMSDIPSSERKFNTVSGVAPDGEEYSNTIYSNETYGSLIKFFGRVEGYIENLYNGAIVGITQNKLIKDNIRDLRGTVLSFSNILDLFLPENLLSIEKEVEISLKLRELGLENVAEELEGITEEEDNRKKCLKARTALEQIVKNYCEKHSIKPTTLFFNLDSAISKGMTEKAQQKCISAQYSFTSKIVHKEIEANTRNTLYAINGIYNIIGSLIEKSATKPIKSTAISESSASTSSTTCSPT